MGATPFGVKSMTVVSTRVIVATIVIVFAALYTQAQAAAGQDFGGGHRQRYTKADTAGTQKPKVDEKSYKAALESLPNRTSDPWRGVR